MRILVLSLISLIVVLSCTKEEPVADVRMPDENSATWRYLITRLGADTVDIGIVDVLNTGISEFENKSQALTQRRTFRYDSLVGTSSQTIIQSVYYANERGQVSYYAPGMFDVLEGLFPGTTLDSLGARQSGGEPHQKFSDFVPGWVPVYKFSESARYSYALHASQRFHLRFAWDTHELGGFVDIESFGVFSGLENLRLGFDSTAVSYRMKTTLSMKFELFEIGQVADTTRLAPFSRALVMTSWFHPEYGLVRRIREPFLLYIPDLPTRDPIVSVAGQRWELLVYLPGS